MLKLRFSISEKRKKQLLRETVEQLQSFIDENYTISTEVTTIATTIDKKLHDEYQKTVAYPCEGGEVNYPHLLRRKGLERRRLAFGTAR